MNCLIYLRVSTKEQAQTNETEGYSIAAQRKACTKYVQEKGWTLAIKPFLKRSTSKTGKS
ncbi:MAG: recombinase family protein [Thermoleophilia bacterium]